MGRYGIIKGVPIGAVGLVGGSVALSAGQQIPYVKEATKPAASAVNSVTTGVGKLFGGAASGLDNLFSSLIILTLLAGGALLIMKR